MANPSKYKPEYCEMLVKHMSEGLTFGSFAAVIRVNRDTIFSWVNSHEDFAEAKARGEAELQLFDEKLLRALITGKIQGGNITGLIFKFKNCHGWRDRHPDEAQVVVNNITGQEAELKEKVKKTDTATLLKIVKDYEKKAR